MSVSYYCKTEQDVYLNDTSPNFDLKLDALDRQMKDKEEELQTRYGPDD